MRLKQYQIRALERFEAFADALASKRSQNERWIAFQRGEGERNPQPQPWCETAWTSYLGTAGTWISRTDGIGRSVPHGCIKIPQVEEDSYRTGCPRKALTAICGATNRACSVDCTK